MPRGKTSETQVANWANGNQPPAVAPVPANLVGGSGTGNTVGKPADSGSGGPISTYGKNKGVNLKATDPNWHNDAHQLLSMFSALPYIGPLFAMINGAVYAGEGNIEGAVTDALNPTNSNVAQPGGTQFAGHPTASHGHSGGPEGGRSGKSGSENSGGSEGGESGSEKEGGDQKSDDENNNDGGKSRRDRKNLCKGRNGVGQ
jgi:hypothetical protein